MDSATPELADAAALVRLRGQPLEKLPEDLYIPPDALRVFLEAFEGPLDLLLYLIRHQNLDILDIPVFSISQQYVRYIELMQDVQLELAAEYLVMAAMLAEIKSRLLLPRPAAIEAVEEDPRMELVRRLEEYERFQRAGVALDAHPRLDRDLYLGQAAAPFTAAAKPLPTPSLTALLMAMHEVMQRQALFTHHQVAREPLSVRARMAELLQSLGEVPQPLESLIRPEEGRAGIVVLILATLELCKLAMVVVIQATPFAPITLQRLHTTAAIAAEPNYAG